MILSLDISSSKTGVSVLDDSKNLKYFNYILTKTTTKKEKEKFKDLYDKVNFIIEEIKIIKQKFPEIKEIHIEEPLSKFVYGKSQISTIKVLFEVNYAISHQIYNIFGVKPIHWNPIRARTCAGVKIKKGEDSKNVIFDFVRKQYSDFDKICGEYKKDNPMVDVADSVIIAIAAISNRRSAVTNESGSKKRNKRDIGDE